MPEDYEAQAHVSLSWSDEPESTIPESMRHIARAQVYATLALADAIKGVQDRISDLIQEIHTP